MISCARHQVRHRELPVSQFPLQPDLAHGAPGPREEIEREQAEAQGQFRGGSGIDPRERRRGDEQGDDEQRRHRLLQGEAGPELPFRRRAGLADQRHTHAEVGNQREQVDREQRDAEDADRAGAELPHDEDAGGDREQVQHRLPADEHAHALQRAPVEITHPPPRALRACVFRARRRRRWPPVPPGLLDARAARQ